MAPIDSHKTRWEVPCDNFLPERRGSSGIRKEVACHRVYCITSTYRDWSGERVSQQEVSHEWYGQAAC